MLVVSGYNNIWARDGHKTIHDDPRVFLYFFYYCLTNKLISMKIYTSNSVINSRCKQNNGKVSCYNTSTHSSTSNPSRLSKQFSFSIVYLSVRCLKHRVFRKICTFFFLFCFALSYENQEFFLTFCAFGFFLLP